MAAKAADITVEAVAVMGGTVAAHWGMACLIAKKAMRPVESSPGDGGNR